MCTTVFGSGRACPPAEFARRRTGESLQEFPKAGDTVLVSILYDGRGKGSGVKVEGVFWYLFRLRDGRVLRWELYPDRAQALEAAGLRE